MAVKLDEARIRLLKTNGTTTIAGGHVYLTGSSASSSTSNTTQLVFGTSSSNHVVLSSNDNALVINPTTSSTTNQIVLYLNQKAKFPSGIDAGTGGITTTGNISGNYIQGAWLYTSAATAQTTTSKIAVIHSDNYIYYITPANLTTLIKNNASGTWAISVSGSSASCTGNAATATKLATARAINGTNFDGTGAITTANWGTARTLTIGDVAKSVNGSTNYTWSNSELRFIKWDDALSNAKLMHKDPMFYSGLNGMYVYNNSGGSHVTVTRITSPSGCPTPSGYCAQIQTIGTTTSPGYGGFYQSYTGRANAVFLIRYLIKLPVGYKLVTATNSMGDGYSDTFITDSAGTGNWTWYIRRVKCGSTGSFSSGGHVYVASNGATTTPSSSNPITWYVGAIYCYDLSASLYTGNNFIDTNVTSAKYLVDKTNGTATYLNYGATGLSTTSWFAAWNGYELRAISPAVSRATMSAMSATSANGYYGMGTPDGTTNVWIRTTSLGIIPYQSGGASALGTSSWPFTNAYINTVYGSLSGNASTATKLATARTINGFSFDGTANISFAGSYVSNTVYTSVPNGLTYIEMPATATVSGDPTYGVCLTVKQGGNRAYQLANGSSSLYYRYFHSGNTGQAAGNGYSPWYSILTNNNYTSYTVTKTGSGASGTWGISISGNAATASSVAWGNVTGKPGSRFVTYYNSNSEMSSTESVSAESYIHTVGASGGSVTTATKPSGMDNAWGIIHLHLHSGNYAMQLGFGGTTGHMYQRHAYAASSFGAWKTILDSSNYTSYTVTKTGTGASGTWGISISGNAASASSVAWGNVSGKPSTFTPSSHTHSYITSKGATVANTRTPAYSESLITGGWASADAGYGSTYGTTLDISGYSTWYHRLAFHTGGQIDYWMGINTTTLTKQSTLITSANYSSYALPKSGGTLTGDLTFAAAKNINMTYSGSKVVLCNHNNGNVSLSALGSGLYVGYQNTTSIVFGASGAWGTMTSSGLSMPANTQISNADTGSSWISGRTNAAVRMTTSTSSSSFSPVVSSKTQLGSWDLGPCHPNEHFYFSYATDTNYNAGTNSTMTSIYFEKEGNIRASKVYGAVWNDYAEFRWVLNHPDTDEPIESGRCVAENGNDSMSLTHDRLQAGARIISDTYGMCMGETEKAKTPIAVCGRVLAYPFERKVAFNVGDPVCSGPNGTVSKMSREEAMMYPERIVGTVVSKPTYKEWGPNKIPVKGRIWIQVR